MRSEHRSLECAILNILWNFEKNNIYTNSVKNVYEALKDTKDSKRAYTTVKTVMDRLHKKNVLLRFKQKNKFFYRTAYSKKDMLTTDITRLSDMYFDGNLELLSVALVGLINESRAKDISETTVEVG